MKIAKGGWTFDRTRYQTAVERFARKMIDERRPFLRMEGDAVRGVRFNSDDAVYARLESNYSEEDFMGCPGFAIDAMLLDAGRSDYWYETEKDYGYESVEDDENIDDES